MDINDVPLITDEIRNKLSAIFNNQFEEIKNKTNKLLTFPIGNYTNEFEYHNIYAKDHNNEIYYHDSSIMMSVFNFNLRNTLRIYKILQLEKHQPMLNAIRLFAGNKVPMHVDLNKGEIGRENPIYSIVVSGIDGYVFMSNKKDGSHLVAVPGKSQFIMFPTMIEHGALAGKENYDILQIQLNNIP